MRAITMGLWVAMIGGCSTTLGDEPRATWTLVADDDLALIDARCTDAACPRYANRLDCERLEISVFQDGRVCGRCDLGADGVESRCGGPNEGLPYRCFLDLASGCTVCDDVHGTTVLNDCGSDVAQVDYGLGRGAPPLGEETGDGWHTPPSPGDGGGDVCYDARRADGSACRLCVDASRSLTYDDCTTVPDSGSDTPSDTPSEPPPSEPPPGEPPPDGGSDTPDTGRSCPVERSYTDGRQRFANELDALLRESGLRGRYSMDPTPPSAREMEILRRRSESRLRIRNLCEDEIGDVERYARRDGGSFFRGGRPRCGYMVTEAAARACRSVGGGNACLALEEGILEEQDRAEDWLEDRYDCVSSPIVIDLDGDGIRSMAAGTQFDLRGSGRARNTAWVRPGDGLLAIDRDGDGIISNGTELFGEFTPTASGRAEDGFAALRELDANGDGALTPADPAFARVVVWRDDGDGLSQPSELSTLQSLGISRIDVGARSVDALDDTGSVLGLWGRFAREDGRAGLLVDVFFAARPRR